MADYQEFKLRTLCQLQDIDPESGKEIIIETPGAKRYIALFRLGDGVRAYLNSCPHQGRSLSWAPDRFLFGEHGHLVCPHHGACFDINTGACISGPCEGAWLTAVDTVLRDGKVQLTRKK